MLRVNEYKILTKSGREESLIQVGMIKFPRPQVSRGKVMQYTTTTIY